MLTQILITLFVIVVVLLFTRMRKPAGAPVKRGGVAPAPRGRNRALSAPAVAAYSLVLVIVIGAMVLFYLQWQDANRVVTIQVMDTRSGDMVTYHAFRKDISGRSFRTVDGRNVSLGDSDRMELIEGP